MLKVVGIGLMNILRIITVLWLVVHFFFTFLYVLPSATPIESTLEPWVDNTIGRYFGQNWEFFAPGAIHVDAALLVRPLTNQEMNIAQTKGLPTGLPNDGWYDLSSPVWAKLQGNRFAAYVRFANGITHTLLSYDDDSNKESLTLLRKFASAFCKDIGKNNTGYIALMIRERQAIPWSDGNQPDPPIIKTKFIGTYPIDRNVENIHLYQL
jgi:hypothetical protein